jgi:hypothetical protein
VGLFVMCCSRVEWKLEKRKRLVWWGGTSTLSEQAGPRQRNKGEKGIRIPDSDDSSRDRVKLSSKESYPSGLGPGDSE